MNIQLSSRQRPILHLADVRQRLKRANGRRSQGQFTWAMLTTMAMPTAEQRSTPSVFPPWFRWRDRASVPTVCTVVGLFKVDDAMLIDIQTMRLTGKDALELYKRGGELAEVERLFPRSFQIWRDQQKTASTGHDGINCTFELA